MAKSSRNDYKVWYFMSKYFEVIGDTGNVVIDDQFECLEVIDSFPLSQCIKHDLTGGGVRYHNYIYNFPRSIKSGAVVGISINDLNGLPFFAFDVGTGYIRFYGQGSGIDNIGIVSVERDDIIQNSTLYVFDVANRGPSEHGIGIEIINENNKIVYTSDSDYLNVIACGSDENKTITEVPITDATTVVIKLGDDNSSEYWSSHKNGIVGAEYTKRPAFMINNNTINIAPSIASIAYIADVQGPTYDPSTGQWIDPNSGSAQDWKYTFSAWLGYGWMVGNVY